MQVTISVVHSVESFLSQCASCVITNDESLRNYIGMRLESIITNLEELMQYIGSHSQLHHLRSRACEYLRRFDHYNNFCTQPAVGINMPNVDRQHDLRGRPFLHINIDQVEMLRHVGYTWQEVADAIGVSRTTLWRRLQEQNVTLSSYTDISDHDLDDLVKTIQHNFPNAGLAMTQGHLRSEGVCVQRHRLRQSVARNDPIRRNVRWHQVLSRRTYSVPGPNSLWHVDGHHSLIRWRFVLHGGIDGYSRMIVYLQCTTNNRAQSVFTYFWKATREYGVPSRVRSDKGGENMMVCYFMVSQRGTGRGSHIAGRSTHNQRIERLWRDVYRCVASTYYELFYYMEEQQMLDPENSLDLFVLHCVFLPQINHSLEHFTSAWNQHPLRTERMWSPRKIWMNGMIRDSSEGQHRIEVIDPTPDDLESFGIDPSGPLPEAQQQVMVPETWCPLDDAGRQNFLDSLSLLQQEQCQPSDYGIQKYCSAKRLLNEILQLQDSSSSSSD